MCSVEGCDKPINRDDVCFLHKLKSIRFGTVPGGNRDQETKISKGREMERGLERYRERKAAGEQPSGVAPESHRKDSYKKSLWEKHEKNLSDANPKEKVKEIKRSLTNTE